MVYALLDENNIIENFVVLDERYLSDYPNAVPVGDIRVYIGDEYRDGCFYHEGERCYSHLGEIEQALRILLTGVEIDE